MENMQMTKYKSGFWSRIKETLRNIFFKKRKEKEEVIVNDIQQNNDSTVSKESVETSKEEIMKIYKGVKEGEVLLVDLDKEKLYKVMLLLNEELKLTENKIKEKLHQIDVNLNAAKMYNKEIELIKKNS